MSNAHRFEVRVSGWLAGHWSGHFEGMHLQKTADGHTTIQGEVPDEAALFGLLRSIEELGLTLLSINAFPKARRSPRAGPSTACRTPCRPASAGRGTSWTPPGSWPSARSSMDGAAS